MPTCGTLRNLLSKHTRTRARFVPRDVRSHVIYPVGETFRNVPHVPQRTSSRLRATSSPTFACVAAWSRSSDRWRTRPKGQTGANGWASGRHGSFPAEVLRRRTREQSPY